jgi:hypothetical protein
VLTPEEMRDEQQLVSDLIALTQEVVDAQRKFEPSEAVAERRLRVSHIRMRIRALKEKHLGHE